MLHSIDSLTDHLGNWLVDASVNIYALDSGNSLVRGFLWFNSVQRQVTFYGHTS